MRKLSALLALALAAVLGLAGPVAALAATAAKPASGAGAPGSAAATKTLVLSSRSRPRSSTTCWPRPSRWSGSTTTSGS
ncbi:hypothetical protein [Dactylosporangium sp. NPDC048998]|uniref:hypothetical protein n=1 Tax=Dactylosporangium sp. NPDC048998 TaxID=3363976 RepID=UPI00371468B1